MQQKNNNSTKLLAFRNILEAHLEVASKCNLNCNYCYSARPRLDEHSLMPLNIAFRYIEYVLNSTSAKTLHLVFHGGEPLLHSINWFRNVLSYAYRFSKYVGKIIKFEMQSNLTLLNEEIIELIHEYGVVVGTSLDGPPNINDAVRGSGKLILENIEKLRHINCFGGVICVIGRHNYDKMYEIMSFFEKQGLHNIDSLIGYSVGRGKSLLPLSAEDILLAFTGIYRYFESSSGKAVIDRNIAAKVSRFLNPPTSVEFRDILICGHPICGAGITINLCNPFGSLFPCGCAVCNQENELTNILGFSSEFYIQRVHDFHRRHQLSQQKCNQCSALAICRSGCAAFGPIDSTTAQSECHANQQFFDFLTNQPESALREIDDNLKGSKLWA